MGNPFWVYVRQGEAAAKPSASKGLAGKMFWATDTSELSVCAESTSPGVYAWFTPVSTATPTIDDAVNTGPTSCLALTHTTSGVPAAGIAARQTYNAEGLAGSVAAAAIDGGLSDVTGGAELGFVDVFTRGATALVRGLRVGTVASAVNYLRVDPSATGVALPLTAVGTDGNVSINLVPKGAGIVGVYGSAPEVKALAAGADMALKLSGKGTGNVSLNGLFNVAPTTGAVAMNGTAPKLSTPAAAATLAGVVEVPVGGTVDVADTTIGANDIVILTPRETPVGALGVATSQFVVIDPGVKFTIHCSPVPASAFDCAFFIIRRT